MKMTSWNYFYEEYEDKDHESIMTMIVTMGRIVTGITFGIMHPDTTTDMIISRTMSNNI